MTNQENNIPIKGYATFDPLKHCWIGSGFKSEWFKDLDIYKNDKIMDPVKRIAEETEEDYQALAKILEDAGVTTYRSFLDINKVGSLKNIFTPPTVPRDHFAVLGEKFYASSCSVSQEQKAIQCFSGQGIGKNLRYQILIEGQMSNVGVFDGFYAQPSLFSVKRTPSVSLNDADTRGYTTVAGIGTGSVVQRDEIAILDGENFGPTNATWNVVTGTYGSATVQYIPRNCFVTISHVQVNHQTRRSFRVLFSHIRQH